MTVKGLKVLRTCSRRPQLRSHQIVDFTEQIIRSVRLGHEAAIVGNFPWGRLFLTGSDDQEDVGPTSVNLSR